jgi:hypothetical protein
MTAPYSEYKIKIQGADNFIKRFIGKILCNRDAICIHTRDVT